MAQWAWQFTGLSHRTKVDDYENMLRHAVEVFKNAANDDKSQKARSVKKLAVKVFNARLKMVKAKRYEVEPVNETEWKVKRTQVQHLVEIEEKLASEGLSGILQEFGVPELKTENE
jgi:hypothetical protein